MKRRHWLPFELVLVEGIQGPKYAVRVLELSAVIEHNIGSFTKCLSIVFVVVVVVATKKLHVPGQRRCLHDETIKLELLRGQWECQRFVCATASGAGGAVESALGSKIRMPLRSGQRVFRV